MTRVEKAGVIFGAVCVATLLLVVYDSDDLQDSGVLPSIKTERMGSSPEASNGNPQPILPVPFEEVRGRFLLSALDKRDGSRVKARLVGHRPHVRRILAHDISTEIQQDSDDIIRIDRDQWKPGALDYTLVAEGYVPAKVVALREIGVNSVELTPDEEMVFRFVDQQGAPISDVRLQVSSRKLADTDLVRPEEQSEGLAIGSMGICEAWSSVDGIATVRGLPPGDYWALVDHKTHLALEWPSARRFKLERGEQTIRMGEVWCAAVKVQGIPDKQFTISADRCRIEYHLRGGGNALFEGLGRFSRRLRTRLGNESDLIHSFVPWIPVLVGDPMTLVPFAVTPSGGQESMHQVPSSPMSRILAPEIILVELPARGALHPVALELRQPDGSLFADLSHRFTITGKTSEGVRYFSVLDSPEVRLPLGTYSIQPTPLSPLSADLRPKRFDVIAGENTVIMDLPMRIEAFILKLDTTLRERPPQYFIDTIVDDKVVSRSYTNASTESIILATGRNWAVEIGAEGYRSMRIPVPLPSGLATAVVDRQIEFRLEPVDT